MAESDVEICNMALARIGVTAFISSLDDATKQARVSKLIYSQTLRFVLADHDWQFAEKRAELVEVANPAVDWVYGYALPVDFLKARYVSNGVRNLAVELRPAYKIIESVLVADITPVTLVYTCLMEELAYYPPHFVDALMWRLAGEFIPALQVKTNVKTMEMYREALISAAAVDLGQQQVDTPPDAEYIRARL